MDGHDEILAFADSIFEQFPQTYLPRILEEEISQEFELKCSILTPITTKVRVTCEDRRTELEEKLWKNSQKYGVFSYVERFDYQFGLERNYMQYDIKVILTHKTHGMSAKIYDQLANNLYPGIFTDLSGTFIMSIDNKSPNGVYFTRAAHRNIRREIIEVMLQKWVAEFVNKKVSIQVQKFEVVDSSFVITFYYTINSE